jgi:hypothetical protein
MHLGDDAVHHGQAQARTFAHTFGGEEGFKNARPDFGWNATAVVQHIDAHKTFWHKARFNGELAFAVFANGMAGVNAQIDQNLLKRATFAIEQDVFGGFSQQLQVDVDAF